MLNSEKHPNAFKFVLLSLMKPSLPKGMRDFGPRQMARRQYIFDTIKKVFVKFGFRPIETPAMENLSTLMGKYGEEGDKLLFKVLNSGDFLKDVNTADWQEDSPSKMALRFCEKGLRYDLTVPFARYVVMNKNELAFPFKRYQIQPVWRADRPQRGRYREFYQCDADVVGTHSLLCEAEVVLMINEVLTALKIPDFTIKINHRDILTGIATQVNADNHGALFAAIDKLEKMGHEKVAAELAEAGFTPQQSTSLFQILSEKGNLDSLSARFVDAGQRGVNELKEVFKLIEAFQPEKLNVELDISLARGLSYYTGCVFEAKIGGVSIGSVCGGGRYDNLTGVFDPSDAKSGVGISFGVDRIYDVLEELDLFPEDAAGACKIMIAHFSEEGFLYGLKVLSQLRTQGIASEIFPDRTKIQKQLEYANKKVIPFVAIIGEDELKTGHLSVKNMKEGSQEIMSMEDIITLLK